MSYKLYVFLRSDLESMTPGKAAAQVAHAASQHMASYFESESVLEWSGTSDFGTTIVLDGGSFENSYLKDIDSCSQFNILLTDENNNKIEKLGIIGNMVTDSSYPLKDGKVYHYINLNTCYWIFVDTDKLNEIELSWLKSFKLYDGNHD